MSHFDTTCVHGKKKKLGYAGAVAAPIFQSATFVHPLSAMPPPFDYTRSKNPTRLALEEVVSAIEGGVGALAFSSGMSAITNIMTLVRRGEHVIASADLYGGTVRYFNEILKAQGVDVSYIDTGDYALLEKTIQKNTRMVFVETPTNPMMLLTDISKVKKTIDSQTLSARKILLVVDNTFLTPYYQKPLSLGADISCHSATKYLGGHNDTLAGLAIYKSRKIFESQMHDSMTTGAVLSPFDSFLTLRGIKTLPLRMDKITANARRLAKFLAAHPRVGEIYFAGKGGMISFAVDSEKTVRRILKNVKIISFAESLGGVETLITYPTTQTHADVPEKERLARGITPTLLRLSCGIENYEDLEEDLGGALG